MESNGKHSPIDEKTLDHLTMSYHTLSTVKKTNTLHHGATNSAISRLKKRWSTLLRSSSLESWRNWMKKSFRCACFQLAFPYEKVHLYHVIPSFGILFIFLNGSTESHGRFKCILGVGCRTHLGSGLRPVIIHGMMKLLKLGNSPFLSQEESVS